MSNKEYYETKLKKINLLIDQKNYKKALELVNEEISSPYIPSEYLDTFEHFYVTLSERVNIEQIENKYNKMSKQELLLHAYDNNKFDVNVFSFFLAKYNKQISDIDLLIIEKIFLDKNIPNDIKIFALEQIKLSEIEHDFKFFNNMTNKEWTLNSMSDFEIYKDNYFSYVANDIEQQLFKDPSLKPLAVYAMKLCYEYYFGSYPPYSKQELSDNLVTYIRSYFDQSVKPDKNFVKFINMLFTSKKLKN